MHDELYKPMVCYHKNILDGVVNIPLGKGIIFPIIDESFIIGPADALRPLADQFTLAFEVLDP
jgi:hypothetical protein